MNTPSKKLIECGCMLGIGATLFLVYAMPRLHETPVGEFLGVLLVFFMYMTGALSLFTGLKAWMKEKG